MPDFDSDFDYGVSTPTAARVPSSPLPPIHPCQRVNIPGMDSFLWDFGNTAKQPTVSFYFCYSPRASFALPVTKNFPWFPFFPGAHDVVCEFSE